MNAKTKVEPESAVVSLTVAPVSQDRVIDFNALRASFDPADIHWRAQSVKGDGSAAMALAYIDARNVMERLDTVVGPDNWQDSYIETIKGRIICTVSLRIAGRWISKSDGAGNTDVEGDKGALSDALKRAAVKWGIGRYLYSMPAPWVPCECYAQKRNDKWVFKRWMKDPWSFVKNDPSLPALEVPHDPETGEVLDEAGTRKPAPREKLDGPHTSGTALRTAVHAIIAKVRAAESNEEIDTLQKDNIETIRQAMKDWPALINGDPNMKDDVGLKGSIEQRRADLEITMCDQLIKLLEDQDTKQQLADFARTNMTLIDALAEDDEKRFTAAYDERAKGIDLMDSVA